MSVAGLFAGIGGFEHAFRRAGLETSMLVEKDPVARAVLAAHFPDAEMIDDVREISALPREITIVTAGFPCQNLSMAGDKSGIDGEKSSVVTKMFEILDSSDVSHVVIENVYFMLQLASGRAMEWLVTEFENRGYQWAYRVLNTMGFGLPQRRRRVYLVASRSIDPRTVLFSDQSDKQDLPPASLERPLGFYWTEGRSGVGFTPDGIPPLKVGSAIGIPSAPAVLFPDGEVLMPSLKACERLQGFDEGWTRVQHESTDKRPEWRLVGNAASVPVAEWVARRLSSPGKVLDFELKELKSGGSWPAAAWNVGEGQTAVTAGDRPVSQNTPSIDEYRDCGWTRLSDRALDGFIGRATGGNLKMPDGFIDALRNAKRKPMVKRSRAC